MRCVPNPKRNVMLFAVLALVAFTGVKPLEGRASEKNVGTLMFGNHYNKGINVKVFLYHRSSPNRIWQNTNWTIPGKRRGDLKYKDKVIKVRGDWWIQIEVTKGQQKKKSKKYRISSVGAHTSDGKWQVYAGSVLNGKSPKAKLPISASRGSARWTISAKGVVTSYIKYTVGSGSGSKKYTTGLMVEYADGKVDTAWATKTVGRPAFGSRKGTAKNTSHNALSLKRLNDIRRIYVKYDTSSSGPNTVREWITKIRKWAKEGEDIYKELKDNELVKDAVKLYAGN